jgi:hypothetical protein
LKKTRKFWGEYVAIALIISAASLLLWSAPVHAYFSNGVGDGTSGNPYHVLNCSNLSNINTVEDAYYVLDNDIDCTGFNYDMLIGDLAETSNGFSGSFDGQGHKITGVDINKPGEDYVGLFARISGSGVVKNLSVSANVHGKANVGILAGDIRDNAQVENVSVFGVVTCDNENCGGITGNQRNASSITKSGSYATVEDAGQSAGGLVGWISHNGTISLSYASGSVTGTNYVGGLVGAINTVSGTPTITDTYSDGTVTASADYVGGLVGLASSLNLTNSYAAGSVTGGDSVGGLVGLFSAGIMAELFSAAEVHGTGGAVGPVTGHFATGTVGNRYFDTVRTGFSSSPDGSSPIDTASDPNYFLNNHANPPMSTWTFDSTHWRTNYNYYPSFAPLLDPIMLCEQPQSTNTTISGTCGIMPLGWGETTWVARWREKGTSTWHAITLQNNHLAQATVTGLVPGTWYQLQFRFTNDFGTGNWGTVEILTTGTASHQSSAGGSSEANSGSDSSSMTSESVANISDNADDSNPVMSLLTNKSENASIGDNATDDIQSSRKSTELSAKNDQSQQNFPWSLVSILVLITIGLGRLFQIKHRTT